MSGFVDILCGIILGMHLPMTDREHNTLHKTDLVIPSVAGNSHGKPSQVCGER